MFASIELPLSQDATKSHVDILIRRDDVYKYFVSFHCIDFNGMHGDGSCEVMQDKKINDFSHIETIAKDICNRSNLKSVVIMNFILLRKTKV
jgi:hypothetical protein